jgi:hypothetical protein
MLLDNHLLRHTAQVFTYVDVAVIYYLYILLIDFYTIIWVKFLEIAVEVSR